MTGDTQKDQIYYGQAEPASRTPELLALPTHIQALIRSVGKLGDSDMNTYFHRFGADGAAVFTFTQEPRTVGRFIEAANYFDKYQYLGIDGRLQDMGFRMVNLMESLTTLAHLRDGLVDMPITPWAERIRRQEMREKIVRRVTGQIEEFSALPDYINEGKITGEDVQLAVGSFQALARLVNLAPSVAQGNTVDEFETLFPEEPQAYMRMLTLPTRMPHMRNGFESLYEYLLLYQVYHQQKAPYKGLVEEGKRSFYSQLGELNKNYPTTNNALDIARYSSLILNLFERNWNTLAHADIAFIGAGTGKRFELPLLAQLRAQNRPLGKIVGIEIQALPKPKGFNEFYAMNVTDIGRRYPGRFGLICIPAAVTADVLEKDKVNQMFASIQQALKPGGFVIFDSPVPLGDASYFSQIVEYSTHHPYEPFGIMERTFEKAGGTIASMFNIMLPEEIFAQARGKGLVPVNFPDNPATRSMYYHRVEQAGAVMGDEAKDPWNWLNVIYRPNPENTRMTIVFRNDGPDEIRRIYGLEPNLLSDLLRLGQAKDTP